MRERSPIRLRLGSCSPALEFPPSTTPACMPERPDHPPSAERWCRTRGSSPRRIGGSTTRRSTRTGSRGSDTSPAIRPDSSNAAIARHSRARLARSNVSSGRPKSRRRASGPRRSRARPADRDPPRRCPARRDRTGRSGPGPASPAGPAWQRRSPPPRRRGGGPRSSSGWRRSHAGPRCLSAWRRLGAAADHTTALSRAATTRAALAAGSTEFSPRHARRGRSRPTSPVARSGPTASPQRVCSTSAHEAKVNRWIGVVPSARRPARCSGAA